MLNKEELGYYNQIKQELINNELYKKVKDVLTIREKSGILIT